MMLVSANGYNLIIAEGRRTALFNLFTTDARLWIMLSWNFSDSDPVLKSRFRSDLQILLRESLCPRGVCQLCFAIPIIVRVPGQTGRRRR